MSQRKLLAEVVEPIARNVGLGEVAYEKLKDIIVRGAFPPNQKLTVRSVAAALGVSTTPARDAINRLLVDGALVNAGPKTVVVPSLTRGVLEEVTAARLALEGIAAERSVQHITDEDIAELEKLQVIINRGLDQGDYGTVLSANRGFHFLIYQRSNWRRVVAIIEAQWLQVGPSLNELYPYFAQNRRGVSNHLQIMEGLGKRDGGMVRSGIEHDIRDGYERLNLMLNERERQP